MSMPSVLLECEKCGFSGCTAVSWGQYTYVEDELEYSVSNVLGWCVDCDNFAPIEDFDDEEQVLVDLEQVAKTIRRMIRKTVVVCVSKCARQYRDNLLDELQGLTRKLSLIGERRATEKCLCCGSTSVTRVGGVYSQVSRSKGRQEIWRTDFVHPGCGGEFLAKPNPIRLHPVFTPNYYTTDGMPLTSDSSEEVY